MPVTREDWARCRSLGRLGPPAGLPAKPLPPSSPPRTAGSFQAVPRKWPDSDALIDSLSQCWSPSPGPSALCVWGGDVEALSATLRSLCSVPGAGDHAATV